MKEIYIPFHKKKFIIFFVIGTIVFFGTEFVPIKHDVVWYLLRMIVTVIGAYMAAWTGSMLIKSKGAIIIKNEGLQINTKLGASKNIQRETIRSIHRERGSNKMQIVADGTITIRLFLIDYDPEKLLLLINNARHESHI